MLSLQGVRNNLFELNGFLIVDEGVELDDIKQRLKAELSTPNVMLAFKCSNVTFPFNTMLAFRYKNATVVNCTFLLQHPRLAFNFLLIQNATPAFRSKNVMFTFKRSSKSLL